MLAACMFKQAVINDKSVDSVFVGERLDSSGSSLGKQCCKAEPVRPCAVQEAIESVLAECFMEMPGLLLHVHASSGEDIAEFVFENLNDRNAFLFLRITFTLKISDFKSAEK